MSKKHARFITGRKISVVLIILLLMTGINIQAFAANPTITVNASTNEGVYSPNVLGNMFEWGKNYMNDAWAEMALNRNFEQDRVDSLRSPFYDGFNSNSLDNSKWTAVVLGGGTQGSYSVANSQLTLNGSANSRYGLISNEFSNPNCDMTVKAEIVSISGLNAMLSVYSGNGTDYSANIEFGIESGVLKVYGDGLAPWSGGSAVLPASLKIEVSHLKGNARTFKFYYNGSLVYTVNSFTKVGSRFQVFIYGWSTNTTVWNSVSIYSNNLYDDFSGTTLDPHFTPTLLAGTAQGSISFANDAVTITGGLNSRYGILSSRIRNSGTDWEEIEAKVNSISGTNALLNIYGGSGAGDFSKFVEFGIEGGTLKVYTSSGAGNWTGASVSLPGTLKVQVTPYYPNGRDYKFYWNNTQVYTLSENKDVPAGDFRLFLYGYSNSVTTWDYVKINQEHFYDRFSPHFEGTVLPVEWIGTVLEGSTYGSNSVGNSTLTLNGGANSRYGVITCPIKNSDIKPYKVSAKLNSYTGTNGLLHLKTGPGKNDFNNFVEFGIEGGYLKVFTPTSSWTGPAASTPAVLDIYLSPYGTNGRDLVFVYNGEPVYELHNYTALANDEFRIFLYGYGSSTTVWDYCTYYPTEGWKADGYGRKADYALDDSATPVSGNYAQKITIGEAGPRKGISQSALSVKSGKNYKVTMWLKQQNLTTPVQVLIGPNIGDSSSYSSYAGGSISGIGSTFQKYTLNLVSNTTDTNAKILIGTTGTGTLWIDQISIMPTDSSEVSYGGWRKDFVDRLVELNPKSLRWPGGCLADWYDWRNGIGSMDSRSPFYFAQWDAECFSNDVGIDEFLNLCGQLNISPVINVNYGTGDSTLAANWVEYCNGSTGTTWGAVRANNGHTQPYNVKNWEIGNETWGWWEPGHTDASTFTTGYIQFRDAMYAKDATLSFLGEGGDGTTDDQSWNTTLVSRALNKIDEIGVHYYFPKTLPQGYNDSDVYNAAMAASSHVRNHLNAVRNVILNNSTEDMKVAVTEYNAMYFNSHQRRTAALEAALYTASLLNAFLEDPGLTDNNFYSCLNEFWDGAAIRLGQRGNYVSPSFYVLKLFANNRGAMKVKSTVTSDTFSSIAIGDLPAISNVPYIEALATRSLDGSKLYLSVVNKNSSTDYSTPISLQGISSVQSTANVYTVASGSYLDINTWQNPNTVTMTSSQINNVSQSFNYTFPKSSLTVFEFTVSGLTAISGPVMSGKVVDVNGNPIQGALVTTNTGSQASTDINGYYQISIPAGRYSITVSKTGYTNSIMNSIDVVSLAGATVQHVILR